MNWFGVLMISFWSIYCGLFCILIIYTAIKEHWCCNSNDERYEIVQTELEMY